MGKAIALLPRDLAPKNRLLDPSCQFQASIRRDFVLEVQGFFGNLICSIGTKYDAA